MNFILKESCKLLNWVKGLPAGSPFGIAKLPRILLPEQKTVSPSPHLCGEGDTEDGTNLICRPQRQIRRRVVGLCEQDVIRQGAGIGAITGTMVGGRQARQQRAAQNQQAVGQQQEMINTYYRAFGACMEGRGYTIK